MFVTQKVDIEVKQEGNRYFVFFNYNFKPSEQETFNENGEMVVIEGSECESFGKIYDIAPSEDELKAEYQDIGVLHEFEVVEHPTIIYD